MLQGPDILVVVLDTLRQDRVGSYGYERDTTPVLDGLAARGTRYTEARSTSSWTSPAHASMLTGLHPAAHGATQEKWDLELAQTTLPEILVPHGYRAIAGIGNPMLANARGYGQGFEAYYEAWRARKPWEGASGGLTTDEATLRWLVEQTSARDERPQFVFVNVIGIHTPYDSCLESCGRYGAALDGGLVDNQWQEVYLGRVTHSEADLKRLSDLYDAEVREADAFLGKIVAAFEAAAGDRPRLVIVTSDHGENLGDHGHIDHVFTLYESVVDVPLVAVGEGFAAGAVDPSPVQVHDVFATVLRAAGATAASQSLPLDEVPDDRTVLLDYHEPVQATRVLLGKATPEEKARLAVYQRHLRSIVEGGTKLIEAEDGLREVYELPSDPSERANVSPAHPELDAVLKARFAEIARATATGETPAVDPETQEALQALGYLE